MVEETGRIEISQHAAERMRERRIRLRACDFALIRETCLRDRDRDRGLIRICFLDRHFSLVINTRDLVILTVYPGSHELENNPVPDIMVRSR